MMTTSSRFCTAICRRERRQARARPIRKWSTPRRPRRVSILMRERRLCLPCRNYCPHHRQMARTTITPSIHASKWSIRRRHPSRRRSTTRRSRNKPQIRLRKPLLSNNRSCSNSSNNRLLNHRPVPRPPRCHPWCLRIRHTRPKNCPSFIAPRPRRLPFMHHRLSARRPQIHRHTILTRRSRTLTRTHPCHCRPHRIKMTRTI
ncbi:hypothetical protein BC940DRAFT_301232 [Gongronella butleri]|nr:hypothetical protein BC940DRAFT_301232 [Gongronella butleri]